MAKSRTVFRRLKSAPPATRALIKGQNRRHVAQLVKAARLNRQAAKHVASLIDLKPEQIPAPSIRRFKNDAARAMRAVNGRGPREGRR